jgi:DNA-binding CsgD family transcriptional regulator
VGYFWYSPAEAAFLAKLTPHLAEGLRTALLIVDAYGLTKREGEITRLVLRGLSTAAVSNELYITPNTVCDHFKSIFDKVGVRSRRELVGQVFTQKYQPRMATSRKLDADGWFT